MKEEDQAPENSPLSGDRDDTLRGKARQEIVRVLSVSPGSRFSNNPFHTRTSLILKSNVTLMSKGRSVENVGEVEGVSTRGLIPAVPWGLLFRPGAWGQEVPERVEEGR